MSIAIVAAAVAAVAGAFVFALPRYHGLETRNVDLAKATHYTPALVRQVFAAHGIRLPYANGTPGGPVQLTLSASPPPVPETRLYVAFAPVHQKQMNWGPTVDGYDHPVGNVLVHYGGTNAQTLAAVKSAVADLP